MRVTKIQANSPPSGAQLTSIDNVVDGKIFFSYENNMIKRILQQAKDAITAICGDNLVVRFLTEGGHIVALTFSIGSHYIQVPISVERLSKGIVTYEKTRAFVKAKNFGFYIPTADEALVSLLISSMLFSGVASSYVIPQAAKFGEKWKGRITAASIPTLGNLSLGRVGLLYSLDDDTGNVKDVRFFFVLSDTTSINIWLLGVEDLEVKPVKFFSEKLSAPRLHQNLCDFLCDCMKTNADKIPAQKGWKSIVPPSVLDVHKVLLIDALNKVIRRWKLPEFRVDSSKVIHLNDLGRRRAISGNAIINTIPYTIGNPLYFGDVLVGTTSIASFFYNIAVEVSPNGALSPYRLMPSIHICENQLCFQPYWLRNLGTFTLSLIIAALFRDLYKVYGATIIHPSISIFSYSDEWESWRARVSLYFNLIAGNLRAGYRVVLQTDDEDEETFKMIFTNDIVEYKRKWQREYKITFRDALSVSFVEPQDAIPAWAHLLQIIESTI